MLRPAYSRQFERDLKAMKKRHKDLEKLKTVVSKILAQEKLDARSKNHKLAGNYVGRWECHLEPDWLLIYKLEPEEAIFERTGTHSDLFE